MSRYIIGVDAGGTKTSGIVYDTEGCLIHQVITGPGNILVDETSALRHVEDCISQLMQYLSALKDVYTIETLVIGMAGVETYGDITGVESYFQDKFPHITSIAVMGDGKLGMIAALQGHDGVYAIAGTGSIIMATYQDVVCRVGGMGHLLGDEGSGYWIGKQLFLQLAADLNTGHFCPMSVALIHQEQLPLEQANLLIRKFYALSKEEVAQYALLVHVLAMNGDTLAINILKQAGLELAKQVRLVLSKFDLSQDNIQSYLAISGSVLSKNEIVRDTFAREIPDMTWVEEYTSPEKAVYYVYKNSIQ